MSIYTILIIAIIVIISLVVACCIIYHAFEEDIYIWFRKKEDDLYSRYDEYENKYQDSKKD